MIAFVGLLATWVVASDWPEVRAPSEALTMYTWLLPVVSPESRYRITGRVQGVEYARTVPIRCCGPSR